MRISRAIGAAGALTRTLAHFTAAYMPLFHAQSAFHTTPFCHFERSREVSEHRDGQKDANSFH